MNQLPLAMMLLFASNPTVGSETIYTKAEPKVAMTKVLRAVERAGHKPVLIDRETGLVETAPIKTWPEDGAGELFGIKITRRISFTIRIFEATVVATPEPEVCDRAGECEPASSLNENEVAVAAQLHKALRTELPPSADFFGIKPDAPEPYGTPLEPAVFGSSGAFVLIRNGRKAVRLDDLAAITTVTGTVYKGTIHIVGDHALVVRTADGDRLISFKNIADLTQF